MNEIKKYAPKIILGIVIIAIIYYVYKASKKVKGGIDTAADVTEKILTYSDIAKTTGLTVQRVQYCHDTAAKISVCLETFKDLTTFEKWNHTVWDSEIQEIMAGTKSDIEMKLISSFYSKEMTNDNTLYHDLKSELNTDYALNRVPYINSIA